MNDPYSDDNRGKSAFNSGIAKLQRIDALRTRCHDARLFNSFHIWKESLYSIRSELDQWMKPLEQKQADEMEKRIDEELDKYYSRKRLSKGAIFVGDLAHYEALRNYELFLGKIEHKSGLGMPKGADSRFALGN